MMRRWIVTQTYLLSGENFATGCSGPHWMRDGAIKAGNVRPERKCD